MRTEAEVERMIAANVAALRSSVHWTRQGRDYAIGMKETFEFLQKWFKGEVDEFGRSPGA